MEGTLDQFDFVLAERLGKTLAEIGAMSNNEYLRWKAWHVYRAAMKDMG